MATQVYNSLPVFVVDSGFIKHCQKCNGEILWLQSRRNGKNYPVDVRLDTMQNKISCRNWFHTCPVQATAQAGPQQQQTLFQKTFNVAGIQALFDKAMVHLKFPKIRLATVSGQTVVLRRAGKASQWPGHLQVTDGGRFGFNKYFGRIDPQGNWNPAKDNTQEVVDLLGKLSDDPAGVASAYGKLTGNCCFCNLPLSDQRSTDVGYGPICADHYGLPWG